MDSLIQAYLYFRSVQGADGLNSNLADSEDAEAPSIDVIDMFCESLHWQRHCEPN